LKLIITISSCELAVVDVAARKIKDFFMGHSLIVKGPMKITPAYGPLSSAPSGSILDTADIVRLMRRRLRIEGVVAPDLIEGMQTIGIPSTCKLEFVSEI
jgi:hypothetical protein